MTTESTADGTAFMNEDEGDTPSWCKGKPLLFSIELSEETPSNNVIKNMHWMAYRQLRQKWRVRIFTKLLGVRPAAPVSLAGLVVIRRCAGQLDWDNAYGGLKPLLDCLVMKTKRNPDGLGLIVDDSPKHMPFPPYMLQKPAEREKGSCLIKIFDLGQ